MPRDNKKTVLMVVWLALLGSLFLAITKLNNVAAPTAPKAEPAPQLDVTAFQKRWPEIIAHAAGPPRGNPHPRYTLVEFGDFQCPQCGKARPVVESMLAQAPGQVNLLFFHRPFPQMHQWALPAAEASEAAAAQGKFWPMYDALYGHQDNLEPGYYAGYAADIGLDPKTFQAALDSHKYQSQVSQASHLANSLNIQLTPTLLLHDNTTGQVTAYAGLDSTLPNAPVGYPGIKQLAARPPWQAAPKTASNP